MRTGFFAFFVLLSFSFLQAQENAGKDRFKAYQELYPENSTVAQAPVAFPSLDDGQSTQAFPGVGVPGFGVASEPSVNVTARVAVLPKGENPGQLEIAARVPKGFKIYALTQQSGGPFPTKIHLPDEIKLVGEIVPSPAAHVEKDPDTWGELVIESHKGLVNGPSRSSGRIRRNFRSSSPEAWSPRCATRIRACRRVNSPLRHPSRKSRRNLRPKNPLSRLKRRCNLSRKPRWSLLSKRRWNLQMKL